LKFLPATIAEIVRQTQPKQRNVRLLLKFIAALGVMVAVFSAIFHLIMAHEGRTHHLLDGVYWTFTVMTTLGFGDITFHSVVGRMFSVIVMLSGLVFLLMLLPFTFIEFFYAPWMAAQAAARTPRQAPAHLRDHVIFTTYEPITAAVIPRLEHYRRPYLVLVPDHEAALRLMELGVNVMLGAPDRPESWQLARVKDAALVIATDADIPNTNAVFTARQESATTPIAATAKELPSTEILPMAGATSILRLDEMLGNFLARCVDAGSSRTHIVGEFGPLLIAEATAASVGLVGRTVRESRLRETTGLTLIGGWLRGIYHPATPDLLIARGMMLILAGSREQLAGFDRHHSTPPIHPAPVVIVGAGRVGRATARSLASMGFDYRFVEKFAERSPDAGRTVPGDAADLQTIREAGFLKARTVIITSHEDDANIYLTVFCRRIRPDIQIIARATHARNVATLHRAGADFVMSYPTLAANALCSALLGGDLLMVAEGVHAFRVKTPSKLHGSRLAESRIHEHTGCLLIGVQDGGSTHINPGPQHVFEPGHELILVGSIEAEERFLTVYPGALIGARGTSVLPTGAGASHS
jgi:Trk K+ transport system NAD-binding subunit